VNNTLRIALSVLTLAVPGLAQTGIVSDDFSGATLGAQWTHVDPLGDTTLALEGFGTEDARVVFSIPEGPNHDLWTNANDAPRILQDCNDVDFEIEVKWDSETVEGWTSQGIVVQESMDKLLRFEINRRPDQHRVFQAAVGDFPSEVLSIDNIVGSPSHMRVTRTGDDWCLRYSFDGVNYEACDVVTYSLEVTQVGVHSTSVNIGNGPAPAFESRVDYFFLSTDRIDPEDGIVDTEPPTANPGIAQAIHVGNQVNLDGSESSDDMTASGDLTYSWTLISAPAASSAVLEGADSVAPSFFADATGEYLVELVVMDAAGFASEPSVVSISSENLPPTAVAGSDELVSVGATVFLDGLDSSDPDEDSIGYSWELISTPAGSMAVLVDADTATPSLTPDVTGDFVVQLVASDGYDDSDPDELIISAIVANEVATQKLRDLASDLRWAPASQFAHRYYKRWMRRQLRRSASNIKAGHLECAEWRLNRVLRRTDGCVLRGTPDTFSWWCWWTARPDVVTDCALQETIYTEVLCALEIISTVN